MKVVVGCEFSGIVREAFRNKGHDAISCDLLPTEIPGKHFQGDIMDLLKRDHFDLGIFHPPCTYLCNSGVSWLHKRDGRLDDMKKGAEFFKMLMDAPIDKIAIENPIMHKYGVDIIGRRQDQVLQPWQFGHGETKAICLWLKNLPKLKPTNVVNGRIQRVHLESPNPERWKNRSRTYQGIAEAMAAQWSLS